MVSFGFSLCSHIENMHDFIHNRINIHFAKQRIGISGAFFFCLEKEIIVHSV